MGPRGCLPVEVPLATPSPPYYHGLAMSLSGERPDETTSSAYIGIEDAAARLRELLARLAPDLRPFPAFLNMVSVQAIELEPVSDMSKEHGCVVVLPDGEICELELKAVPGIEGISEVDQLEDFRPLDLSPEDYIIYAAAAIRAIYLEVRRRDL